MSLIKYLFQLSTLEFPPKKLFGNKDERVIAERRSHLEVTELSFCFSGYKLCHLIDQGELFLL